MLSIDLNPVLLLSMPGGSEWILILLVVLLFFGGKKIPDLMKGIGRGVREFNDAKTHVKDQIEEGMKDKDNGAMQTPQSPSQQFASQAPAQQVTPNSPVIPTQQVHQP